MKKRCFLKVRVAFCLVLTCLFAIAFPLVADNAPEADDAAEPAADTPEAVDVVEAADISMAVVEPADLPRKSRGWRIGAGVMRRNIGKAQFNTRSYSPSYSIPDKSGSARWGGRVGDRNVVEDRVYRDGYVGRDYWTDLDGGTWNWGYDNPGQVSGNMVTMEGVLRTVRSFDRSVERFSADWGKSSDNETGVFIEAEKIMNSEQWLDYGIVINASRASFGAKGGGVTINDKQTWNTRVDYVRDSFDISGTGITSASQPYHGTESGPGPQINNVPADRQMYSRISSSGSYEARNYINSSLDMDISTFSLGLSASTSYRRLAFSGSAGPSFNIIEKEAKYEETLYESVNGGDFTPLMYWNDTDSENEFVFGAYVQGSIGLRVIGNLELSVFGRYDWLEKTSGNVGLSSYSADLSGGTFGGMLNVCF